MKKSEIRKRTMRLLLIGGSSFVLLIACGLVDGYVTHRWTGSKLLEKASATVGKLPKTIGDWESKDLEITDQVLTVAGATGYVKRIYTNTKTKDWIAVTMLCGPHGPISLHPPTVCFTGAGWKAKGSEERVKYTPRQDVTAMTWQTTFRKQENLEEQSILTDWTWSDGTGWHASKNPRYEYAGSPYLFKLYVVSDSALAESGTHDGRDQFVKALLNEIDRTVFKSLSLNDTQDGSAEL